MMNVFEGSRRIALLIAGLGVLGACVEIFQLEPFVEIKYRVPFFGVPPVRSDQCDDIDAIYSVTHKTPEGRTFHVRMCFAASRADNGKMLIPYIKLADGRYNMGSEYSNEVREYTSYISEARFAPTTTDMQEVDREYLKQSVMKRIFGLGWLAVGLATFWAFICAIGWIVRGFAGIPRGQDRKMAHPPGT